MDGLAILFANVSHFGVRRPRRRSSNRLILSRLGFQQCNTVIVGGERAHILMVFVEMMNVDVEQITNGVDDWFGKGLLYNW